MTSVQGDGETFASLWERKGMLFTNAGRKDEGRNFL
jgi:hypothetical protein